MAILSIDKEEWKVREIGRISPSRFGHKDLCLLKEIWSANGKTNLLGNHPDAVMGSLIHKVLEKIVARDLKTDFDTFWAEEERLFHEKFPDVYPLRLTARLYWTKKKQVKKYSSSLSFSDSSIKRTNAQYKTEFWVESVSGKIGGRIDLMRIDESILSIIDFKTGKIYEQNMELKKEYEVQMKLYAALCKESSATGYLWPTFLYLVDLSGQFHEIVYTHEEAEALLKDAEDTLDTINKKIRSNPEPSQFAEVGGHCTFCQFRPACTKYQNANYKQEYFQDLFGTIEDVKSYKKENFKIILVKGISVFCTSLIGHEDINTLIGKTVFITHCMNQDNLFRTSRYSKIFII